MPYNSSPFFLDVVLSPHRSLTPRGFTLLMLVIAVTNFGTGAMFATMGAWPVLGFFGLDVLLLYIAFRLNFRSARLCEVVRVTRQQLTIQRIQPNGRQKVWSFEPAWARVELHRPEEHNCRLEVASGRSSVSLGEFLSPEERIAFAETLRSALLRARTYPVSA